jgi:hypothetical protein
MQFTRSFGKAPCFSTFQNLSHWKKVSKFASKPVVLCRYAWEDPAADRAQLNQFRAYLNHLIFTGADKKFPARLNVETDHLKPMLCPIGWDRMQAIGGGAVQVERSCVTRSA